MMNKRAGLSGSLLHPSTRRGTSTQTSGTTKAAAQPNRASPQWAQARIAAGGADAANLTALIAESLVDVILRAPEQEQAQLMAHTLSALGDLFLQKSGTDDGGSGSTH